MADVIITRFQAEGLKEYQNELSNTAKETKKLKDSTSSLSDEEAELVATLEKGKQKLKELSEQEKTNTKEYKKLDKEIKAVEIAMKGQGEATVSLRTKQRVLLEQFADMRLKLEQMSKAGLKGTETYNFLEKQLEQTKIEAGQLNDLMGDVSFEISQLGSDTQGIDKTLRGITAVAGAFSAVQGAIGLFGAENEQLEKTLLKVNSAMALASGTQQFLTELRQKDTIFLGIQTNAQKLFNLVVGQSTGVLKLLRIALATVGIGLIISAIAILIKNFDKLKNFIFKLFPPLEKLGKNFKEIKENVVTFIKEGVLKLLNSFAKLYNNSLLVRQAIFGIGATVKSVAQIFITQFKNIGTIIEAVWKAIRSGGKDIKGIFSDAFNEIKDRSKETGEKVIGNFKDGFNNAKDSELKELTLADLDFGGGKAGEKEGKSFSENLVKEAKTGLEKLKEELTKAQKDLEDLASNNVIDGAKNESEVNRVIDKIRELNKEISTIERDIEFYIAISEFTPSGKGVEKQTEEILSKQDVGIDVPINIDISKFKKEVDDLPTQTAETPFLDFLGLNINDFNNRTETIIAAATSFYESIASIGQKVGNVIQQANQIRTQNELDLLEKKKEQGIISERQYEREVAKVKTEAAKRQRRADIINAAAMIPQAILSAYTSTPGGIIAKGIAAAIAGAFAIAQVALIAKAPLPKFRKGGLIKGASHEAGGVDIPVRGTNGINAEGGEFIFSKKAVNQIGVKNLELLNKKPNLFANVFYKKPLIPKNEILNNNKYDNKEIKKVGNILREEFGLLKIDIRNSDKKKLQAMRELKINNKARS